GRRQAGDAGGPRLRGQAPRPEDAPGGGPDPRWCPKWIERGKSLIYNRFVAMTPVAFVPVSRRHRHGGGPVPLLLPAPRLPRLWQAGAGQLDCLRPLRRGPAVPAALLPHLQGPLLRAQGHPAVPLRVAAGEGAGPSRAPRRPQRGPSHLAAGRRAPRHRGPLRPALGRARPAVARRAGGPFPPGRAGSSAMRSGPSSPGSRGIANRPSRPTTIAATGGTSAPTTRRATWSSAEHPGRGALSRPRRWWPTSAAGRRAAPC